ncbi:MAG: hypothetical protein AMXMBFR82_02420 [Candidatus Hydrogenedentota bacterium]
MATVQTLPLEKPQGKSQARRDFGRYFYTGAAFVLLALMFLGFQQFYLHGRAFPNRELTPPIRIWLIVHGVSMTAWMLLFLAQPLLVVAGNRRIHMMAGRVGAVLAAGVVAAGLQIAFASARVNPPELKLWNLEPNRFLAVPLFSILLFGAFVFIGVWNRKRPKIHRPMMLLATMAAIPAAMDRIDVIRNLYAGTVFGPLFGPFFAMLVLGLVFLVVNRLLTRSWDRYYAAGYAVLAVSSFLIMRLASTNVWDQMTKYLLG